MKRQIITLMLAIVATLTVSAQKLVLKLEDGTKLTYETWQLDSLFFVDSDELESPATAGIVNLGFAQWASFNLGATSQTDPGWLVGWGDVTGTNKSTKLKYFPAETYSRDIYETAYDIVKNRWGADWRLPVADDIQKLKDNCTWEQTVINEVPGWKVTSKMPVYTDQYIFLPFTGYRNGTVTADADAKGLYWSGSIADDNTKAKALLLTAEDSLIVDSIRSLGFAIRPIYGKFVHPLSFSSFVEDISQRTYNSASVVATVQGNMAGVDKVYICFGLATQNLNPLSETGAVNKREQTVVDGHTEFVFNISNLDGNTQYKAVAFLYRDETPIFSDTLYFQTNAKFPVAEAVDLGLSVYWASWNMGESNEAGIDHLYGWGDGDGELTTTSGNAYAERLGYSTTSLAGDLDYDIATKQWGNGWRMPTQAEFNELCDETKITISEETIGGIHGYRYTSKIDNTKSIFIPWCGGRYGTTVQLKNQTPYYWSANCYCDPTEGWKIYAAQILPNSIQWQTYPKYWGLGIRPVKAKSGSSSGGGTGGNGGNNGNTGDNTGGGTGDNTGGNTGGDEGGQTTPLSNQAGVAISLGLPSGTKWADRNVGASSATEMGGYYSWADVNAGTTGFDRDNYRYYDATTNTYGKFDAGNITGDVTYDVAAKVWGGTWRIPGKDQIQELVNNCTWEWTTQSGVAGYKVTGPNGNYIFLPACGSYFEDSNAAKGVSGRYWSSSAFYNTNDDSWAYAFALEFNSSSKYRLYIERFYGCCVRPIQP